VITGNHSETHSDQEKESINLPNQFDIHRNTDEVLHEMNYFRKLVDKNTLSSLYLNFDKIKYLDPSSALMLAAEVDVWNTKCSKGLKAKHKTWDKNVKALLCEMGFFELLKMSPIANHEEVVKHTSFLKFLSGQNVDGEKAKELREGIEVVIGKELEGKIHLYSGLTEAVTNTKQHAYGKELQPFEKWWMAAAYNQENMSLIVSMYDRGKSIPKTIYTYSGWERIQKITSTNLINSHKELIAAAMQDSFLQKEKTRTQTRQENRGKGLKQLLDFIKEDGELTVVRGV